MKSIILFVGSIPGRLIKFSLKTVFVIVSLVCIFSVGSLSTTFAYLAWSGGTDIDSVATAFERLALQIARGHIKQKRIKTFHEKAYTEVKRLYSDVMRTVKIRWVLVEYERKNFPEQIVVLADTEEMDPNREIQRCTLKIRFKVIQQRVQVSSFLSLVNGYELAKLGASHGACKYPYRQKKVADTVYSPTPVKHVPQKCPPSPKYGEDYPKGTPAHCK